MIYSSSQGDQSLNFSAASNVSLPQVASLTHSVALTTVQSMVNVPFDCKIIRVELTWLGTLTGTATFNVVYGSGTSTGVAGQNDTNAPVNTPLFAVSPSIGTTAGVQEDFYPDVINTIYPASNHFIGVKGYPMTLRFTSSTGGSDGISSLIAVNLVCMPINQHAAATGQPFPDGGYVFDGSAF